MARDSKPNILFFFADQLRFDSLGSNGAYLCRTPAVDRIASEGARFSRAYTPISLCSPARASLFTGLFAHTHGQLANTGNFNGVFDTQVLDKVPYPRILAETGYSQDYFGKWHLARWGDTKQWGFDRWWGTGEWHAELREQGTPFDYGKDEVQRLEWGGSAPFCGRSTLPADKLHDKRMADKAIEAITAAAGSRKPFSVFVSFFGPHFPHAVPEPYDTMYDPSLVRRWGNFAEDFSGKPLIQQKEMLRWNASHLTWPQWQKVIAHYWGYCSFLDDQIARVLACLRETGQEENTLVILTADHGDMLGSHRLFNKGMQMYEETHHIPMVARWPRGIPPHSVCEGFVSLVDLMPTILDAAAAPAPEGLAGRSLLPLLRGETGADWRDDIYAEFHGYEPALCTIRMVRTADWKYVYNPCSEDELYDMQSDPHELANLAGRLGFKHVLRRMKGRMLKWLRDTHDGIADEVSWQSNSYDLFVSGRET